MRSVLLKLNDFMRLCVYFQGIFKEKIWSWNHLALKGHWSQEPEKPFSTVFEMIF